MKISVFHSYPTWQLSGVNTWTVNMIRGMRETDYDNRILITGVARQEQPDLDAMGLPYSFLELPSKRSRKQEWKALKEFLEAQAPCIYIPNYDFHRSCAAGTLSPDVKICAVIHSDENCYYDELKRLGSNFDAIAAVSSNIAEKIQKRFPDLAVRTGHIPYGIPISSEATSERPITGPLRLAYCNRLQQYQKRIFDLPTILQNLKESGVAFHLTIAGDGPDIDELIQRIEEAGVASDVTMRGRVSNSEVLAIMKQSHCFMLTSDFEGLPLSLLEAMSVGCLPIVYHIDSGINDVMVGQLNDLVIPHSDTRAFAIKIAELASNREQLSKLSSKAMQTVNTYASVAKMCEKYQSVFDHILKKTTNRTGRINKCKDLTFLSRGMRRLDKNILKMKANS